MVSAAVIAISYLVGAIPFGLLFTRAKGIDIRKVGSGNIGATNVMRAAGKGAAALTLTSDLLKGSAAVALAKIAGTGPLVEGMAGLAAVLGHDFPVYLRFKGGKGVATSLGVILLYTPQAGILTVVIWLATAYISRHSSLGALVSFGMLPGVLLVLGEPEAKILFAACLSALLFIRHAENIRRLARGTESKIGEK